MPSPHRPCAFLLIAGWLVAGLLPACKKPDPPRPLPAQAFVWQRVWRPAVAEAVRGASSFEALHVLAAELSIRDSQARIVTVEPDWPSLQQSGRAIGAVLRLHGSIATRLSPQAATQAIRDLAAVTVRRFDAARVPLAELQLDYDCPQSRLADYTRLLRELKKALPKIPLRITALPAWLGEASLPALLAESPDYVLQLHSLHLPEAGIPATLFDPTEARRAVIQAARLGIPFRIALPTYSCLVEFDDEGRVREVHGEDVPSGLALSGSRHLVLDSDAFALAEWLNDLRQQPPPTLSAVIWYRLPVATDRLNWPSETLTRLVAGTPLQRHWQATLERREDGAFEVLLHQEGDAPDELPREITLEWQMRGPAAADGLRGYQVLEKHASHLVLQLQQPGRHGRVRPGTKLTAGWVRFEHPPGDLAVKIRR